MDKAQLQQELASLPGWTEDRGMLRKTFRFGDFREAIGWVVRVAFIAEAHGHHPDIDIRYNRVSLALVTHDAGNMITEKDVALARDIEAM